MRYLKYIFGIQLFLASMWTFYYTIYWAGFLLLTLSLIIPVIYNLLTKKLSIIKACSLIFSLILILFGYFGCRSSGTFTTSYDINKSVDILAFERSLYDASQPCFAAYDKAFSKSVKYHEEQCSLINDAKNVCNAGQQYVDNVSIPGGSSNEVINLLKEAKLDAKNGLLNWENFFSMYNNQCISNSNAINQADAKIQLIEAVKNMYLVNIKLKKAESVNGY